MKLVDVGFGNFVAAERIISISSPDSLPVRRLMQDAKNIGRAIDVSCGKKTKAVILMDSEHIILSSEDTQVIAEKIKLLEV